MYDFWIEIVLEKVEIADYELMQFINSPVRMMFSKVYCYISVRIGFQNLSADRAPWIMLITEREMNRNERLHKYVKYLRTQLY